jgi:hypothetical protein
VAGQEFVEIHLERLQHNIEFVERPCGFSAEAPLDGLAAEARAPGQF